MNAPEKYFLPDVQASADTRQLAINKVGIKGLRYPLTIGGLFHMHKEMLQRLETDSGVNVCGEQK